MNSIGGILRLVCVFAVSIVLILYNAYDFAVRPMETKGESFGFSDNDEVFETVAKEETATEEKDESKTEKTEEKTSSAVETAAKGTVKGKIIERYISPYSAPSSYNGVYMKNSSSFLVDIKTLLASPLSFKIEKNNEPQVLIVHTHTTETFMTENTDYYTDAYTSRTRDKEKNMVMIGKIVAEKLNAAGIKTIHATAEHDYPEYTGSYSRSAETVISYQKKYPSIKIVLDLHRDAVSQGNDKAKLITKINGKQAAQVMLVMGSKSAGENWRENLKLALRLQQMMETKYPTLARPLSLTDGGYNQALSKGSLLIEFGTDANTLEEAKYSASLVGESLVSLLNTIK